MFFKSLSQSYRIKSTSTINRIIKLRCYSYFNQRNLDKDTIFALTTSPQKSGVAIVRVSGEGASKVLSYMTQSPKSNKKIEFRPRHMAYCKIINSKTKKLLDMGMCVYFKAPSTFTGQDIVELNLHGSLAVIQSVLQSLEQLNSVQDEFKFRLAQSGEFIKRAFLNNKLDLTEVEGLADLINSETEVQHQLALRHFSGEVKQIYQNWKEQIIESLAILEAYIDFGEDEEIDLDVMRQTRKKGLELKNQIEFYLKDHRKGQILTNGIQSTILGPPNAGKSTLLNYLAQQDLAIVSPIPGTTRDVVTGKINLEGMPLVINDTAGIRNTMDPVELEGVKRAKKMGEQSDIKLLVFDGKQIYSKIKQGEDIKHMINSFKLNDDVPCIVIINKCEDFDKQEKAAIKNYIPTNNIYFISCKTKMGLDYFLSGLVKLLKQRFDTETKEPVLITHERHRVHLNEANEELEKFMDLSDNKNQHYDIVLAAEHLKKTATAISKITGGITYEDILDKLFSSFCIGK